MRNKKLPEVSVKTLPATGRYIMFQLCCSIYRPVKRSGFVWRESGMDSNESRLRNSGPGIIT